MNFIITIIIGILPSFIWLLFFLRHDVHPEPKTMIFKVFFAGALIAPLAALIEVGFQEVFLVDLSLPLESMTFFLLYWFVAIGFTEEFLKYLVVRQSILAHHEFDEPVDAMLYMIISGLGFAALENILVFLSQKMRETPFIESLPLVIFRFLGAVFLHALCSALIGYFLALSICHTKHQTKLIATGLILALAFHGLFDIAITKILDILIETSGHYSAALIFWSTILFAILIGLACFITHGFKRLKKMQSVCLPDFVLTKSRRAGKI
jgi:RsiW-degrading membrane proteinase PrsW (M82 family)